MRGKPIEQITVTDLHQLIADGVAEDRRLEFKVDVPVSTEEQKRQKIKAPDVTPTDRSWVNGRSIQDYGRDALVEEIVAFANADGGTLVLGMDETVEPPPRASGINALPDVAGLERRLRDVLMSCVEPRLPYVAVRALPTSDDGSGVVLIETSSSTSGPHWVVKTRRPTIRREDRCVPLSMLEVHDMVLRNTRGRESIQAQVKSLRELFSVNFQRYLENKKTENDSIKHELSVEGWLAGRGLAALGAQVVVTPQYDLCIPRLENMDGVIPSHDSISIPSENKEKSFKYRTAYDFAGEYSRRILGGVVARQEGGFQKTVKILRTGQVIVDFMQIREVEKCTCNANLIIDAASFAAGVYNRLRLRSSYPMAAADLVLDIFTRRKVGVGSYAGFGFSGSYGALDEHISFPAYQIGEAQDITILLNEIACDMMNAAGMPSSILPKVVWSDPN